ncbi:NADH-quinone oxidoreductase subunit NuoN [Terrihabitans rhizophilus]|jgi:NADH-quinone oxidoreductase subunit N|uniref:NADH-quinone oxidoreductase subunit N n=1 Tax=Terrihabitans rhizophilus TaxID=3092662 RepID=A0ABU4RMN1_9HYPH|nr:NADH-quinone oxidoreductase subunit NuoN [Terrihabitans sp. PJ23]MDX6805483.1 NADH-quinone oxidoreductase subunit NuoN [Terrihabitans sp. PJ23]
MNGFSSADLAPALPELLMAAGALILVLVGAIRGDRSAPLINGLAIALLIVVGGLVLSAPSETVTAFNGSFVFDRYAQFLKVLVIVGALGALVMSFHFLKNEGLNRFEFAILIILSTTGMMIMVSAGDLIALYLGFELQSLALYVIASFHRDNLRSTEAGLKYFVLGALSSGMLLYGCSLIYGFSGTVAFAGIAQSVTAGSAPLGMIFGLVFLFAGLAFKVSAVPFHMWTPDVYEGAPTPVTAFFAAAPKVAAMALFTRVAIDAFPQIADQWRQIVVFIAIASMALGSFAAIGQRNIKRLMAYSSIGNVGYILVGLAAGTAEGVQSVLIYLVVYVVMTLGCFAVIMGMRRDGKAIENVDDLAGLARNDALMGFIMAMMMFSLAGIPPLAGFFAKFYVFLAAINAQLYWLAVIGVVTSVVGAFYYLRIVKIIYFDEPAPRFERMPMELRAMVAVTGAFVLLYFIYPAPMAEAASAAARSLF